MPFASRSDLLARSSARRLAQLAVPTDVKMVLPEDALRAGIAGGDLSALSVDAQRALELGLETIDQALSDAHGLMLGYGIPDTASSPVLSRLCATIALYYLQGSERMPEDMQRLYDAAIGTLKSHARGDVNLLPVVPLPEDQVLMGSAVRRYGSPVPAGSDW